MVSTPQHDIVGIPIGWGAVFSIINLLLGGSAIVAWIKNRGAWRKIALDADEQLRSEMWKDIEALKKSKEVQSQRMTRAEAQIAGQTIQIGQQRFVLTLVIEELERIDPGNSVARQARALLLNILPPAFAYPADMAAEAERADAAK